jgi:tryptophan halogenase
LENYQYVLYGMDFNTDLKQISRRYPHIELANKEVKRIQHHALQAQKSLLSHREMINKIKQYGISKI